MYSFYRFLVFSLVLLTLPCQVLRSQTYKEKRSYKEWVRLAPRLDDAFMSTDEAQRIADNVILYQHTSGGWPKNIYMPAELSESELREVEKAKDNVDESTIDNDATSTEIIYLSRVFTATGIEKYRDAAIEGIRYLLKMQYANGGWPQFWPRNEGYYVQITYNDEAMVNVMELLRHVNRKDAPFAYVDDELSAAAGQAFDMGVECMLNTQYRRDGTLTVWCAQHDRTTLQPCQARAYELPSLSGAETCGILNLLMSIENPSDQVCEAIEAGVAWLEANKITNLRRENFTNEEGKPDYRMVTCTGGDEPCPTIWARFYTLEDDRPFFSDRDGVKRYDISEIGYERRNGYGWYTDKPAKVLRNYEKWKERTKSTSDPASSEQ